MKICCSCFVIPVFLSFSQFCVGKLNASAWWKNSILCFRKAVMNQGIVVSYFCHIFAEAALCLKLSSNIRFCTAIDYICVVQLEF